MSTIAANLEKVNEHIHRAAHRAKRNVAEITLVAVTKTHPVETVIDAYQAGLRHFGENRAQDGVEKISAFTCHGHYISCGESHNSEFPFLWRIRTINTFSENTRIFCSYCQIYWIAYFAL